MEFHYERVFAPQATRIVHRLTYVPALQTGDRIIMQIDRPRRYAIMRDQTLTHFLFSAFNRHFSIGVGIKGCPIEAKKAVFSLKIGSLFYRWANRYPIWWYPCVDAGGGLRWGDTLSLKAQRSRSQRIAISLTPRPSYLSSAGVQHSL